MGLVVYAKEERDDDGQIVTMVLDQRGILAVDRETKLFGGPSRYLPTGVYKKPDEPIIIAVSSTDQKVFPQVVISDPILQHYVEGNKDGIPLKEGKNVISTPQGGVVHLINESDKTSTPPVVTIEGGEKFTYFVLGEHTLEDWYAMLEEYKDIPAIELVGERVFITASYNTAKDIDDPIKLLQCIDEAIEVENRVSGLDESSPDPRHRPSQYRQHMRENNSPGTYMYMFYNHTGYNSDAMKTILNTQRFTQNGWGPWHELGHTYQQGPWKWDGVGEVTVNIYSLHVQKHFGNKTRLEQEGCYDRAFAYLNQPDKDYNKIDDLFVKLVMFWQLDLAFGDDFYPTLHRTYREMPKWQRPTNDHDKIQTFIATSSQVADRNLGPFFEMWGLIPTQRTNEQISHLPDLTRPIWSLTDANTKEIMGALGHLAGVTLTCVTPVEIEAPELVVERVRIAVDGEEVYQGARVPVDLVLKPAELARGNHQITATIIDDQGEQHHHQATFRVEHFHLTQPKRSEQGAERLSGLVNVIIEPVIPPGDIVGVTAALQRIVVDLGATETPPTSRQILFADESLPLCFPMNTLEFVDGAYDLIVNATTVGGVFSELKERIVIRNWEVLEDHILPPQKLAWFGTRDSLKTVEKSDGWVYAQNNKEQFFGDGDRIMRGNDEEQYLIWSMPNLYEYAVTLYATTTTIEANVLMQLSVDGESWVDVSYRPVVSTDDNQWFKLDVLGTVPKEVPAGFFRIVFTGNDLPTDELQLGFIRLSGVVDGASLELLD